MDSNKRKETDGSSSVRQKRKRTSNTNLSLDSICFEWSLNSFIKFILKLKDFVAKEREGSAFYHESNQSDAESDSEKWDVDMFFSNPDVWLSNHFENLVSGCDDTKGSLPKLVAKDKGKLVKLWDFILKNTQLASWVKLNNNASTKTSSKDVYDSTAFILQCVRSKIKKVIVDKKLKLSFSWNGLIYFLSSHQKCTSIDDFEDLNKKSTSNRAKQSASAANQSLSIFHEFYLNPSSFATNLRRCSEQDSTAIMEIVRNEICLPLDLYSNLISVDELIQKNKNSHFMKPYETKYLKDTIGSTKIQLPEIDVSGEELKQYLVITDNNGGVLVRDKEGCELPIKKKFEEFIDKFYFFMDESKMRKKNVVFVFTVINVSLNCTSLSNDTDRNKWYVCDVNQYHVNKTNGTTILVSDPASELWIEKFLEIKAFFPHNSISTISDSETKDNKKDDLMDTSELFFTEKGTIYYLLKKNNLIGAVIGLQNVNTALIAFKDEMNSSDKLVFTFKANLTGFNFVKGLMNSEKINPDKTTVQLNNISFDLDLPLDMKLDGTIQIFQTGFIVSIKDKKIDRILSVSDKELSLTCDERIKALKSGDKTSASKNELEPISVVENFISTEKNYLATIQLLVKNPLFSSNKNLIQTLINTMGIQLD